MPRILWVGCFPPEFHSIGDHAQTLAITQFLEKEFSDYEVNRFYRTELYDFFKTKIQKDDLIFIHSSGDFGDLYRASWHDIRKKIIAKYPHNKIIQLPVSVYYRSVANFEADKIFFSGRKNIKILCRTVEGTELLQNNFDCDVKFFPDFAFSLKPSAESSHRKGQLVVFRSDAESRFKLKIPEKLIRRPSRRVVKFFNGLSINKKVSTLFKGAVIKDVQLSDEDITDENRKQIVLDCLNFYKNFELVLTDRFHACVFSYLTQTPFVAFEGVIKQKTTINPWINYDQYFEHFRELVFSDIKQENILSVNNNVMSTIKNRRSTRKWSSKCVETHKIKNILEAGVYAPSAANLQATRFKVLGSPKDIHFICQNTSVWFKNSNPNKVILVFYDANRLPPEKWTRRFVWQDTACAMQNMMLAAKSLDLKSCWASVNPRQEKNIKHFFKIPGNLVLACMLFLGYSDVEVSLSSKHQGRCIMRSLEKSVLADPTSTA